MPIPLEAGRLIVGYVGNRADICTLSRVSKGFQVPAERALYNTLDLRDPSTTITICRTLARQGRLSSLVEALTIVARGGSTDHSGESLPPDYWHSVAAALRRSHRLRFLNIYIENGLPKSQAWILQQCTFQLSAFHCDLDWDADLIQFFNRQQALRDLYILDYNDHVPEGPSDTLLQPSGLAQLSTLECTFTEAANVLIPGRPVVHLKTCLSSSQEDAKRREVLLLISKIRLSSVPTRSIDLGDPALDELSSFTLLMGILDSRLFNLRYLGTLLLPVGGRQRLRLYGLLMRMRQLDCLELEVSHWDPEPTSDAALRSLFGEVHLYCETVTRVVFVYEFERFLVTIVNGTRTVDEDTNVELLWREV
ncbi:hypothetical protein GLOTRDRAFT_130244 [Gloeophyllum trabeum ATCC 11539]|uniref:F-box domain-containing protein n=1 Tax=Gloeophyllum trabeum (strain ATCC 11539 / FP-39264 / Madison 617) TaxID=670483 RepID=S7Q608_GLOTA|nr:uncharacterized protein GLOTRDRAFT_130244 [Gloeophyllum trabeum ATCC 11539]EPQ54898.1 hypothetical protein GLOTRDRAFT_130244 [Gloeophyllum trabeum ATCC 11539]